MKSSFKYLLSAALAAGAFVIARAQPQPTNSVSITNITVSDGTVKSITINNPGSGYAADPQVTITGDGINATATASRGVGGSSVSSITVTNAGSGYSSTPTVTVSAPEGTGGVTATAYATLGGSSAAIPNESFGPAGTMIIVSALAVGTTPATGFTYEFFVDGTSIGVVTPNPPNGAPARVGWTPPQPGAYFITSKATGIGAPVTSLPVRYYAVGTMITSPTQNTIVPYGSSVALQATATPQPLNVGGNNAFVRRIDFYSDGVLIGSDDSYPYSLIYTPSNPPTPNTPNIKHVVEARAYDNNNNQVSLNGAATLNLFMVPPIGTPPTSVITSPANNSIVPIGSTVPVAVAAGSPAPEVKITKVELYIDGVLSGTTTAFPYSFNWTPTVVGNYRLLALAYDDKSNVVASTVAPASTIINVAASPTVSVLSPADGASLALGAPVSLMAAANDSNVGGSVTRVQFFVNGTFVGESSTPSGNQFSTTWTPSVAGAANITAVATNQAGLRATSDVRPVSVLSSPPDDSGSGGGGTAAQDLVVEGLIFGGDQPGSFTAVNASGGGSVLFVGSVPVGGTTRSFFFSGIQTSDTGTFSATNASGQSVSGTFSDTGAFGTLNPGGFSFSGTVVLQGSTSAVAAGFYSGTISNRPNASLTAIVAPNRSITLLTTDGSNVMSAKGVVSSTGAFSVPTPNGTFTGTVSPTTGFVTGTITGGGVFTAASASDIVASNGFLRNISTLGQVGTGANVLIAGLVVGGTAPKQVLVRAVGGASLSAFNVSNTLANPQLAIFSSSTGAQVASNDNWGGNAAVAAASTQVGAFGLSSTSSTDAAVLATLSPGGYTVQVSGVGGTSGTAIVEFYDTDTVPAFSTKRLVNISTRGLVSPSQGLVAGFIINGTSSKTVLIRGAGPGLGTVTTGLSLLADPSLRLTRILNTGNVAVRENDNWEIGNDPALVSAAAKSVGAFPFVAGSKDAAILINLPPGVYTADLLGATTGLALIEVYEVP